MRFADTFGGENPKTGQVSQWLGVRADHDAFHQDQIDELLTDCPCEHGSCAVDAEGSESCECFNGWGGDLCDQCLDNWLGECPDVVIRGRVALRLPAVWMDSDQSAIIAQDGTDRGLKLWTPYEVYVEEVLAGELAAESIFVLTRGGLVILDECSEDGAPSSCAGSEPVPQCLPVLGSCPAGTEIVTSYPPDPLATRTFIPPQCADRSCGPNCKCGVVVPVCSSEQFCCRPDCPPSTPGNCPIPMRPPTDRCILGPPGFQDCDGFIADDNRKIGKLIQWTPSEGFDDYQLRSFEMDLVALSDQNGDVLGYTLANTEANQRPDLEPRLASTCPDRRPGTLPDHAFPDASTALQWADVYGHWSSRSGSSWLSGLLVFDPSIGAPTVSAAGETILEAFEEWTTSPFSNIGPYLNIDWDQAACTMNVADTLGQNCIKLLELPQGKRAVSVVWLKAFPRDQAHFPWTDAAANLEVVKADIGFNSDVQWTLDDGSSIGPALRRERSLRNTAVHEYGHLLGLRDKHGLCSRDDVMFHFSDSSSDLQNTDNRAELFYPGVLDQSREHPADWRCHHFIEEPCP